MKLKSFDRLIGVRLTKSNRTENQDSDQNHTNVYWVSKLISNLFLLLLLLISSFEFEIGCEFVRITIQFDDDYDDDQQQQN